MNFKLQMIWALQLFITFCCVDNYQYTYVMNSTIDYIQKNLQENRVTLFQSGQELSFTETLFKQKFINTFPTVVVNMTEVLSASRNKRLLNLKKVLSMKSESKALYVMFVNNKKKENAVHELLQYDAFTLRYRVENKRPKCLVIFSNDGINMNFHELLKRVWSHKFLDATVIELLQTYETNAIAPSNASFGAFVHT